MEHGSVADRVVDEFSFSPSGDDAGSSHLLQMLGGIGGREAGLIRQRLDAAFALREQLQQLEAMRMCDRLGHGRELDEQRLMAKSVACQGFWRGRQAMLPYEIAIRLSAFAGVFVAMAAWELLAPRRRQASER